MVRFVKYVQQLGKIGSQVDAEYRIQQYHFLLE
jgi:hypothetical protein